MPCGSARRPSRRAAQAVLGAAPRRAPGGDDFGQADPFEGLADRHVDTLPGAAYGTKALQVADPLGAFETVGQRDRPIDRADDVRDRDLLGRSRERVAAAGTAL